MAKNKFKLLLDAIFILIAVAPIYVVCVAFRMSYIFGFICLVFWFFVWLQVIDMLHHGLTFKENVKTEVSRKPSPLEQYIGKEAFTVSSLNPMGTIEIEGERIEAKSSLGLIPVKSKVKIVEISGNSVVVETI